MSRLRVTRFTMEQLPTLEGFAARGPDFAPWLMSCSSRDRASSMPFGDSTDGANPRPPVIAGALKVYGRTAHRAGGCG